MMEQMTASTDRLKIQKATRVIAITSGKGGVGKTNIAGALSLYFAGQGRKVMILDADLGLSNIDVLFGISPEFNIENVLAGEKRLSEIVVDGPGVANGAGRVRILPASSGSEGLANLSELHKMKILSALDEFDEDVDILIVDTGAGIAGNVTFFCEALQEIIVVVTPEPTSITDAYALIKVLSTNYGERKFRILVNMASGASDALETFRRISLVADRFLNISLDYVGFLTNDPLVRKAVRRQQSFLECFPAAQVSKDITAVGRALQNDPVNQIKGGVQFFLRRLFGGVAA